MKAQLWLIYWIKLKVIQGHPYTNKSKGVDNKGMITNKENLAPNTVRIDAGVMTDSTNKLEN